MTYSVEVERTAEKELLALPPRVRARILGALQKLATDPFTTPNVKALKGGAHRMRVGDYRVIFSIKTEVLVVLVVKIGHRKDVYRD